MQPSDTHLDATVRIPVFAPLRRVNDALLDLLRSFTAEEWQKPTVHPDRNVKDLTAHLLQTTLNRVSMDRDGFRLPLEPIGGIESLIAMIQRENREFMTAMRWVSPRILIELDPDRPGDASLDVASARRPLVAVEGFRRRRAGVDLDAFRRLMAPLDQGDEARRGPRADRCPWRRDDGGADYELRGNHGLRGGP